MSGNVYSLFIDLSVYESNMVNIMVHNSTILSTVSGQSGVHDKYLKFQRWKIFPIFGMDSCTSSDSIPVCVTYTVNIFLATPTWSLSFFNYL
jgi:hypothetical protein